MKTLLLLLLCVAGFQALAQDSTLKEYVGVYTFPEGSAVTSADISLRDSVLFVSAPQGSTDLKKMSKDTFSLVNYNGTVYFVRNAQGAVNGLKLELDSMILEAKKERAKTSWYRKENLLCNELLLVKN